MSRMAVPALAGLAVALTAVLASQFLGQPMQEQRPASLPAAMSAMPATGPMTDPSPGWVAEILARPLFTPDRRPVAVAAVVGGPPAPGLPRLAGVMVTPSGRRAIFAGANATDKPLALAEGGRIGAFTVSRIEDGAVTVLGPDGARVVRPSFATGSEAAAIEKAVPPAADGARLQLLGASPSGLDLLRNAPNTPLPAAPRP